MNELNVIYQSDNNYAGYLAGSVASLLENNKLISKIQVHILDGGINMRNINLIKSLVNRYGRKVYFYNTDKYEKFCKENKVTSWHNKWITWYKMFAISDLKNINSDRVLYINPQCLIVGIIDGLLSFDFDGKLFGLSYDWAITKKHKRINGLGANDGYYNCGVMLINYKKWIEDNITEQNKKSLKLKSDYLIVDQDFINSQYKNDIIYIGTAVYNIATRYYTDKIKSLYKIFGFNDKNYHKYDDLLASIVAPKIIYHKPFVSFAPYDKLAALWSKYSKIAGVNLGDRPTFVEKLIWATRLWAPNSIVLRLDCLYIDCCLLRNMKSR